jgi:hypothetical protein
MENQELEKQEPMGRYRKLGKIPYAFFLVFMVAGVALAVFYIFGFTLFGEALLLFSLLDYRRLSPFLFLALARRKRPGR